MPRLSRRAQMPPQQQLGCRSSIIAIALSPHDDTIGACKLQLREHRCGGAQGGRTGVLRHRSNLRLTFSYITRRGRAAARPHAGASTSLAFSCSISVKTIRSFFGPQLLRPGARAAASPPADQLPGRAGRLGQGGGRAALGFWSASHTVIALEDTTSMMICMPEHVVLVSEASRRSTEEKARFLRSLPAYAHCSRRSLQNMAEVMVRKWVDAETPVVIEVRTILWAPRDIR